MTPAMSSDGWEACGSEVSPSHCERCTHEPRELHGALDRAFERSKSDPGRAWRHHRTANPGERIVSCGEASRDVFAICKGWGYRFSDLSNGRRQILGFLLPGDLFTVTSVFERRFSFCVEALTEVQIAGFRRTEVKRQLASSPGLRAKWADSVAREARVADELLVVLGQCTAEQRVAYLILYLTRRMQAQGLASDHRYRFPLKQTHIADALGVTSECVCRVLGRFRKHGILALSGGYLEILDSAELERIGPPRAGSGQGSGGAS